MGPSHSIMSRCTCTGVGAAPWVTRRRDETPFEWHRRGESSHPALAEPLAPICDLFARARFAPKAKSVIWLFMRGGVSHMESFDPKPALTKEAILKEEEPKKSEPKKKSDSGKKKTTKPTKKKAATPKKKKKRTKTTKKGLTKEEAEAIKTGVGIAIGIGGALIGKKKGGGHKKRPPKKGGGGSHSGGGWGKYP